MRSTFYGLEVARSGLYTAQNQLNITGHNISNVDTVGYTRQRLNTAAVPPQAMNVQIAIDTRSTAGRGVTAVNIEQIRSAFTDAKYRMEKTSTGYWQTRSEEFALTELVFNNMLSENTGSIHGALMSFYDALNELAKNNNTMELRQVLKDAGIQLAESVNYAYEKLEQQHQNINTAIGVTVDQINDIGEQIANLNRQIFGYELTGSRANDLRDSRNLLLDQLSEIVNIEYYTNAKGQMVVTIGGTALVSGAEFSQLVAAPTADNKLDVEGGIDPPGKQYEIYWSDSLGNPTDPLRFNSGKLQAYFDLRDGETEGTMGIPYVAKQLNDLCRKIAQEVNEVHRQGYTMPYTVSDALGMPDPAYHSIDPLTGLAMTNGSGVYEWDVNVQPIPYLNEDGSVAYWYYESRQGVDFFNAGPDDSYKTITAKNFRLSDEMLNDSNLNLIAASSEEIKVSDRDFFNMNQQMGNTENMHKLVALFEKKDATGKQDNFESMLISMTALIANQASHVNSVYAAQAIRMHSVEQERASVSDVSLDDEMTDMIRFQHAYNASSRVITAIDEQLDTIINRMGMVGR